MYNQLGISLKRIRKQQGLSQKKVATGICARSMLADIESGKYIPNAQLLLSLCDRLAINLAEFSLAKNFSVSTSQKLNSALSSLCKQHDYVALKEFLLDPKTIDKVKTAKHTQAYYYYLSIVNLKVDSSLTEAERSLKLSLSSDEVVRAKSPLKRLGLITLGLVKAKAKHREQGA